MSKKQQLYNLVMGAYAGLPEAAQIAAHHSGAVKEKNALKHWEIHGPGIQQAAEARRNQLRMQQLESQMRQAEKATQSRLEALQKRNSVPRTLQATLGQSGGGVRGRRSRQQLRMQEQGIRASSQLQSGPYLGLGGGASATPYGSSINLA